MSQMRKDLKGKPLEDTVEEKALPVCWKGMKPFESFQDVKDYFKPLLLSFTKTKNVHLQIPPEAYLIVTVSTSRNSGFIMNMAYK